jgi:hypothetical protein
VDPFGLPFYPGFEPYVSSFSGDETGVRTATPTP